MHVAEPKTVCAGQAQEWFGSEEAGTEYDLVTASEGVVPGPEGRQRADTAAPGARRGNGRIVVDQDGVPWQTGSV